MSEQKEQDWKETRIVEYARLGEAIEWETYEMDQDSTLRQAIEDYQGLGELVKQAKSGYLTKIENMQQQQAGIKLELAEKWNIPEKTFECNAGTATLRTTRSLIIRNKQKLIEFLTLNKKLSEFIKGFEITKLRKIKDAGLLENEIATWDEKRSISISLTKEAEQ